MSKVTIRKGGKVFRWAGGTFMAVWDEEHHRDHVPDDVIQLPKSLNRSQAGHKEMHAIACEYLEAEAKQAGDMHEPKPYTGELEWPEDEPGPLY